VTHKPKSKKKLLHNPIIAANWYAGTPYILFYAVLTRCRNQKETLTQNYRRLGLTSKVNNSAGGTQKPFSAISDDPTEPHPVARNTLGIESKLPTKIDISEVKIQRDPTTGKIVQVLDGGVAASRNPLSDPLNAMEEAEDEGEGWAGFVNEHGLVEGAEQLSMRKNGDGEEATEVIRRLEEEAAQPRVKRKRNQSEREAEWVQRLVDRHGDNFGAMSRDAKLNPMQQSAGDIKKRVKKWKDDRGKA